MSKLMVTLADVQPPAAYPFRRRQTMATIAAARFYRKHLRDNHTSPSLLERASELPSLLAVDEFLKEIAALTLKRKLRKQLEETCRVRLAALQGVVA